MTEQLSSSGNDSSASDKSSRPELSAKPADKRPLIATIAIFVVFLLIFIGLGFLMWNYPSQTAVLRDMFIILLALETILIALIAMVLVVALVYIVLKINDLVQLINNEVKPLLEKANSTASIANDTARTVQSRVVVVSDEAVKPVMGLMGNIAAAKAITKTLFKRNSADGQG